MKGKRLLHHIAWASPVGWLQRVVLPAMEDALCDPNVISRKLFPKGSELAGVDAPLNTTDINMGDDRAFLLLHVRMSIAMVWQLVRLAISPSSPPWMFCRLLQPGITTEETKQVLAEMKAIWTLVQDLSRATAPVSQLLLSKLTFMEWAVVREPQCCSSRLGAGTQTLLRAGLHCPTFMRAGTHP